MFRIGELVKRVVFNRADHGPDDRPRPIDGLPDQVYRVTLVNERGFVTADPVLQLGQIGPRMVSGSELRWFARHFEPGLTVELTRDSFGIAQADYQSFTIVRLSGLTNVLVDPVGDNRSYILEQAALRMYLPDTLEPAIPYVQPTPVPFAPPVVAPMAPPAPAQNLWGVGGLVADYARIEARIGGGAAAGRANPVGRNHQAYIVLWINDRGNGDTKHKIFYNRPEADDFVRSLARWQRVIKQTSIRIPLGN